jgi:hypothetical protein
MKFTSFMPRPPKADNAGGFEARPPRAARSIARLEGEPAVEAQS